MCFICDNSEKLSSFCSSPGIKQLELRCENLETIPVIPRLQSLVCISCNKLKTIPVIPGLEKISLTRCNSITEIPYIPSLKKITVVRCNSLREIKDDVIRIISCTPLQHLYCDKCPLLVKISYTYNFSIYSCPWICSPNSEKMNKVKKIQNFYRKNLKFFRFKRWIKSEEFAQWFYAPENFGGFKHKQRLEKILN